MPAISAPSSALLLAQPNAPSGGRPIHQTSIRPDSDDTIQSEASSKYGQLPAKHQPQSDNSTLGSPPKDEAMAASRTLEPLVIPRVKVSKAPMTPTRLPHEFDHIAYMEDMETDNRRYSEAKGLEKFIPEDGITPINEGDEPLRYDVESMRSLSRLGSHRDAMSNHHGEEEKVNILMAILRKVKSATDLVVITSAHPFALSARPNRLGRGARPRSRERPKSPTNPNGHGHPRSASDSTLEIPEKARSWLFSVRRSDENSLRKVTV